MATQQLILPRALDANGNPASGARALVYQTGTTTPVTVYTDTALSTAHANPIIANSTGYFAQAFYGGVVGLKVVFTDSAGGAMYTLDPAPITGVSVGAASGAISDANAADVTGLYHLAAGSANTADSTLGWLIQAYEVGPDGGPAVPFPTVIQTAWALAGVDLMLSVERYRNNSGTWSEWRRVSASRDWATYATTSGTTVEEIAVPIYADRVSVLFEGVTIAASNELFLRVRQTTTGIITTGTYQAGFHNSVGAASFNTSTSTTFTGFPIGMGAGVGPVNGRAVLERLPGTNKWFLEGRVSLNGNRMSSFAGHIPMTGTLNGIRLQSDAAAFTAGAVTFRWHT